MIYGKTYSLLSKIAQYLDKETSFTIHDIRKLYGKSSGISRQLITYKLKGNFKSSRADTVQSKKYGTGIPGVIKIGYSRATKYKYKSTANWHTIIPRVLEFPEGTKQTLSNILKSLPKNEDYEMLIIIGSQNRDRKIYHCLCSGQICDDISARVSEELRIEYEAWKFLRNKVTHPASIPKVKLYNLKHLGTTLIVDYSESEKIKTSQKLNIMCIPKICVGNSNLKNLEKELGNASNSDSEIRNEIMKIYKIINISDCIDPQTFFIDWDLRFRAIPIFFRLFQVLRMPDNYESRLDPNSRIEAANFWQTINPSDFHHLKPEITQRQIALGIK